MNWRGTLEALKERPYGLFLVLAAAAGGLRTQAAWFAFAVVFLIWASRPGRRYSPGGSAWPALFFCWLAAAAVFSPDPAASLSSFGRYAVLGLAFFSAAASPGGGRGWLAALYAVGGAAAAALLFQRAAGLGGGGIIGANPNYSAAFCAAAFPAALLAASGDGGRRSRALYAGLALLLAGGVAASGSRGAALAAFLAAAAGLAYCRRWRALAALTAAALAAAAFLPAVSMENLLKLRDPRAFQRPALWGAALKAASASPLLGWGPGLYGRAFELFKFPFFDGISYYGHGTLHAHSEPLNLAAEAGFPAAAFFLLAAFSSLARGGREELPYRLAALAVLLQGSVDMIFYSGAVGLLFWGSLGFSLPRGGGAWAAGRGAWAAGLALLACLALSPAAGLLGGAGRFRELSYAEAARGRNPALALALLRDYARDNPRDPFPAEAEGRARLAAGDLRGAEEAFLRALSLEPDFAAARLGLAGVYAAAGRKADACRAAGAVAARPAGPGLSDYDRGLLGYDEALAKRLKTETCGKNTTGGATAPSRKIR